MNWIESITDFILDREAKVSSKAAVIISIVFSLILIDNIFGFSFHYNKDKKIDEIERLNAIIKDNSVDSATRAYCIQMRADVINQKDVITQASSFFRNTNRTSSRQPQKSNVSETPTTIDSAIKNNFWFHVSASGIYYIAAVFVLFLFLFLDRKRISLFQRIILCVSTSLSMLIMAAFVYWIDTNIPQLSKTTWVWNYIVNATIQITIVTFLVILTIKANKKQK